MVGLIERRLGVVPLPVKWLPVTVQTRSTSISGGAADLECGAGTVTPGRMKGGRFLVADLRRRHRLAPLGRPSMVPEVMSALDRLPL